MRAPIVNDLNKLYTNKRTGRKNTAQGKKEEDKRSQYQRDFDRIVFSSSFRRLQNKTQVFSLPGSKLVHNRLTHSLEVASVGRSLGTIIGQFIAKKYYAHKLTPEDKKSKQFYENDLPHVIAAACLCHDIGNPAFGHFGEDAIATYFKNNRKELRDNFSTEEWKDFINFEGNANSFRVLTKQQNNKPEGGLGLTYSTLAAIAKYPCSSSLRRKSILYRKKFGFFQDCKDTFKAVAEETGMKPYTIVKNKDRKQERKYVGYYRHPFVWLVEAADDICYNIIDLEDAHRLGIVSHKDCIKLLVDLISEMDNCDWENSYKCKFVDILDPNEKIAYLRSKAINCLIFKTTKIYENHFEQIIKTGKIDSNESIIELVDKAYSTSRVLRKIENFSVKCIYPNAKVRITQTAGYNVLADLLGLFVPAILEKNVTPYQNNLLNFIPDQYKYHSGSPYQKVMGVLDFVSGMTDNYATSMYRSIKGIDIGMR